MIRREYDAKNLNAILNDPRVRPWVADAAKGTLDLSPQVANKANVLLTGEYGCAFFFGFGGGLYELHTQVLPEGRGAWVHAFGRACANYIFTHTDAWEVLTRVPQGHIAAKAAALEQGFRLQFTRPSECNFRGKLVDVGIYSMTILDWVERDTTLVQQGRWLHERMHEEAQRLGIKTPPHEDDENHNRYVGACIEMAMFGQAAKAVPFFNRWALVSRHATIQLLSLEPPTIRFDVGIMRLMGGDIEIVKEAA